jgi:uncharacterized protein YbjT (DUF2867 family)
MVERSLSMVSEDQTFDATETIRLGANPFAPLVRLHRQAPNSRLPLQELKHDTDHRGGRHERPHDCRGDGPAGDASARPRAHAGEVHRVRRKGVEVVCADMSQPGTLAPAMQDVQTVMLISSANERMVHTQCTFVDAAKAAGVERIVKFSGQESGIGFDASAFRFTRMHEEIERHIQASGLRWLHLRPSQFMQVYLREAQSIARDGVLALPAGDIALSPVDLDDVANIAAASLTANDLVGEAIVCTGPQALSMEEIVTTIGQVIARPVTYRPISLAERRDHLMAAGVPEDFIAALDEQAVERLRHPRSRVDLGAHERFGIRPTHFAEFVRRHRGLFDGSLGA